MRLSPDQTAVPAVLAAADRAGPALAAADPAVPAVVADRAGPAVRGLMQGDDAEVQRLFRETMCLGRPLSFEVPQWDAYQALCLDWYLGPGRDDVGVLVDAGTINGYALVCTDAPGHQRWLRYHAAAFSARAAWRLVAGRMEPDAARFLRLRLRDGWGTWRRGIAAPLPAHAHINLAPPARATRAGRLLADHVDRRCRIAGLPGWFGEMNAIEGHRARALERLGGTIVHRVPNHTLSWLLGQPVERLTVARWLPTPEASGVAATDDSAAQPSPNQRAGDAFDAAVGT